MIRNEGLIVKGAAAEAPKAEVTVMEAVPAKAMRPAGTAAVSWVGVM